MGRYDDHDYDGYGDYEQYPARFSDPDDEYYALKYERYDLEERLAEVIARLEQLKEQRRAAARARTGLTDELAAAILQRERELNDGLGVFEVSPIDPKAAAELAVEFFEHHFELRRRSW